MTYPTPSIPAYSVKSAFYMVPSSKPGAAYRVTVDPADGSIVDCECKDRKYRRRECRHMRLAGQADHGGLKIHVRIVQHTRETAAAAESPAAPAPTFADSLRMPGDTPTRPAIRPRVPYAAVAELYA